MHPPLRCIVLGVLITCLSIPTLTAQPGRNDPTFNAWTGSGMGTGASDDPVDVIVRQPDGRLILAGEFFEYNGQPANRIVRITADGVRDASFNIGTGANQPVWAVVVQPDGKIILGGEFTSFNGTAASKLVRLNANGSIDPTFHVQPMETGIRALALQPDGRVLAAGSDQGVYPGGYPWVVRYEADGDLDPSFSASSDTPDGAAVALRLGSDGTVLVGGSFSSFNGVSCNNLVRLEADGDIDPTFDIGSGFDATVYALLQQPDDAVLVGGAFTSIDGTTCNGLARLLGDGGLDPSFDPGDGFTDTGGPGIVYSLALWPDGRILAGGQFNWYDGMQRGDIAQLNADGSLDASFQPGSGPDGYITALCTVPGDKVIIVGSYNFYHGVRLNNVARLNANASLDGTFNPTPGFNGVVLALAVQPNGQTIVGGTFTEVNGVARNRIARLNANGTLDATFDPGSGFNDVVAALALQPDGKVIVGGDFSAFNGTGRNGIARLTSTGGLDATFNPGSGCRVLGTPGGVLCLALQSDGKVLVAGAFNSFNGAFANRIVRLRANGALDGTFNAGTGFAGYIFALALAPNGKVYIGGSIDHHDLNEQCPGHVARLNGNGTLDTGFTYDLFLFDSEVHALALQADGDLIVGADDNIRRFAGGVATVFGPGGCHAMVVRPDDKVVIGGQFEVYAGTGNYCIARLNAGGGLDASFAPLQGCEGGGFDPVVNALGLLADGRVMVGGEFTAYDGAPRRRITRVLDSNCVVGSPCDDGDPNTTNSVLQSDCSCNGGTICGEDLDLVIATDAGVDETTWEIVRQGTTMVVASGGPLAANALSTADICLSAGCYELHVMDAAGDGMTSGTLGGYVLSDENGARIIDNTANGSFGSLSAIASNGGFCLPMGTDQFTYTSCDKLDWVSGEYLVASINPAVSTQFGLTNTISGYEFWIFNPNGGYSFRRFRDHATSDGFAPNNAARACHMKINNWAAASQIPANMLMNVRVRGRVAGVNNEWGPACRFKIDPVQAACPLTKLMDIPGSPFLSCGTTRMWGSGKYVHARPVNGATQYQWRFRIDTEGFLVVRTTNTYFVQLNWMTNPLQNGKTYHVEVRAFKNGAWCVDNGNAAGGAPFLPWGDVCNLTIDNTPANADNQNFSPEEVNGSIGIYIYPNPNRGDQLHLNLDLPIDIVAGTTSSTVSLEIFDVTGKRMMTRTLPMNDGLVNTTLDLSGSMVDGMYFVNIIASNRHFTERLVIER